MFVRLKFTKTAPKSAAQPTTAGLEKQQLLVATVPVAKCRVGPSISPGCVGPQVGCTKMMLFFTSALAVTLAKSQSIPTDRDLATRPTGTGPENELLIDIDSCMKSH